MVMEIPLTQGRVALVDDEDYPALSEYKWHYHNSGYAARRNGHAGKYIFMHDVIMNVERGVDHKNWDKLNNQKSNLRVISRSGNNYSRRIKERTLPRGVEANGPSYSARIVHNYKRIYLGVYPTPEEASHAYREKAFELFGEYPPE